MERTLMKKELIEKLKAYQNDMRLQELSEKTICKYLADIKQWIFWEGEEITKNNLIDYKLYLTKQYKVSSVNSKIVSINRYLKWLGYKEINVRIKKVQQSNVLDKMITKENYYKMLNYAKNKGKNKIYCIMRTIATTGIRIGELKFVTVMAVSNGYTQVCNKGKYRYIYLPECLCRELLAYCEEEQIIEGCVFRGREGKAISSTGVWKSMKGIAKELDIPGETVFPHSLRHLFAKNYMEKVGDVTELADILGHSRLETTWIYTKTTSAEKRARLNQLDL